MIEINNLSKIRLDKRIFSTVAKKVLSSENRRTENISLAFVDKEEIKKLNKKFRKKNKPTDVLSFELRPKVLPGSGPENYLGEVIICPHVVKDNAEKYGVTTKSELLKVFVHGILHLCGYDHEKSKKEAELMERKQNLYLKKHG
jgi:rRNA maturation RNase YbeY